MNPLYYLAFAAGFVVAGGLAGVGGWAYDTLIDDPAVASETRKICVSQATQAALEAQLAAQRRAQEKIDALTKQFAENAQRRSAENAQTLRELNDEITAFENAGGSMCSVTVDNLDFLRPR